MSPKQEGFSVSLTTNPLVAIGDSLTITGDPTFVGAGDRILVTGAAGFIGSRVVEALLRRGFCNIVCFTRPSSRLEALENIVRNAPTKAHIDVVQGNLLHQEDCDNACKGVSVIFHLAAGTGEKSFPDAFMNSVVATRNLLEASRRVGCLRRFVLVSSLAVYANRKKPHRRVLDETCPLEEPADARAEAYSYAKIKQEQLVREYGQTLRIPYVVVRPGSVYGPRKAEIVGRVGIGTFGLFLHMGGSNRIPFTYVDNCADAIVLAGIVKGVDGEVFNVIDDDLPSSSQFLRKYKRSVKKFRSFYVPHAMSHALCYVWETYANWSKGQLPPVFNRSRWHAYWKKTWYTNAKLKRELGWTQRVSTAEGLARYFEACKQGLPNA
jgi:nucleoside-diphosphate-sugar epimerase